jgi:hypothetical protein
VALADALNFTRIAALAAFGALAELANAVMEAGNSMFRISARIVVKETIRFRHLTPRLSRWLTSLFIGVLHSPHVG